MNMGYKRSTKAAAVAVLGILCLFVNVSWASEVKKIQAFVSILPQAYFVERVGGESVKVTVLVGPGQSPATYEPTPHDISHLSDADVYFKIGVPFEVRLLDKATKLIPDLNVVDTRSGIILRQMEEIDHHHDHDHEGGHDPHIWLDPQLVKIQAATICNELKRINPQNTDSYDKNLQLFHEELDSLDIDIAQLMEQFANMRFYTFHPSFGYFADRYGLVQVAVEVAGKEPGARQLAKLIEQARQDSIGAIFVQAQFTTSTADAIAREIGVEVVTLDPLTYDYLSGVREMAEKIAKSVSGINESEVERGQDDSHK
jgi:zinc transport system substrate-binding protein